MGNTISTAFISDYADDVKHAFQRRGSLLLGQVRRKTNVKGSSEIFQKLGSGTATRKSRNGLVIPMNPEHATATATLVDRYAPEYVDELDEEKIGFDERQALVNTGAWALGRAADADIITVLDAATTYQVAVGSPAAGLTIGKIMEAQYEKLIGNGVQDDGDITWVVGAQQWGELMQISQFSSADYVGDATPFLKGSSAKRWLNATWILHTGLTLSTTTRYCFCFHKSAIGHASGHEIDTRIDWVPDRAAWLVNSMMSMGACLIDALGVVQILCSEA